jgi:hypothetical protein
MGTEALGIKFPLVKKAIVSGLVQYNGINVLLSEGDNNPGFSKGVLHSPMIRVGKRCTLLVFCLDIFLNLRT